MPPTNRTKAQLLEDMELYEYELRQPFHQKAPRVRAPVDSRKRASDVLDKMQAMVASEVQTWKRHCGSCTTLEQAGVTRAHESMELEEEILQEYEKLQTQVESSFHNIRVKTDGKLLAPHEQQTADLLDRNRELENRLKETKEQESKLKDELATLRETLGQKDLKISKLESKFLTEVGAFGARAWNQYFGDVGQEPPLPQNIVEIMESPCPFWTGKRIQQTHLLVLIPSTVNGQPFSLDLLETLVQNPKSGGNKTLYRKFDNDAKNQIGSKSVERPYWILITREIVPNSTKKTYDEQRMLIASHGQKRAGMDYKHPSALEAVTAVLTNYVRTGEHLVGKTVWTFCDESIYGFSCTSVGHFDTGGIQILYCVDAAHPKIGGLACCAWKQQERERTPQLS